MNRRIVLLCLNSFACGYAIAAGWSFIAVLNAVSVTLGLLTLLPALRTWLDTPVRWTR